MTDIMILFRGDDTMTKAITCCFTGYRANRLPYGTDETHSLCEELKCVFSDEIDRVFYMGYTHFITGLSWGTETWFAEVVLFMKRIHPSLTIECTLSDAERCVRLNHDGNKRYQEILRRCDRITVLENIGNAYKRNRYLVDRSSLLIGAYNGLPGINRYMVEYARMQRIEVILIDPARPRNTVREIPEPD
jgi:uncharacterized phage-like protein YoqJ